MHLKNNRKFKFEVREMWSTLENGFTQVIYNYAQFKILISQIDWVECFLDEKSRLTGLLFWQSGIFTSLYEGEHGGNSG